MMNKQELYEYLEKNQVWHEITEHGAVYNMEELSKIQLPYPEADAKNLFVRDDKRRDYYLITVKGDKRVDLKAFKRTYNTRSLTFVSAEELMELMGLIPGAVTPFGLLNDTQCRIKLFLDNGFSGGLIGVHPNDNTATVWLYTDDLVGLIRESGHEVQLVEL